MERREGHEASLSLGSGLDIDVSAVYAEYVEKYGRDNADYLMEVMGAWQSHYQRAVYIDMGVGDGEAVEARAQEEANRRGWAYERMEGNLILIRRLLVGDWDKEFLVLKPGQELIMTHDDAIVGCIETDADENETHS